jgi:hypothetical protein
VPTDAEAGSRLLEIGVTLPASCPREVQKVRFFKGSLHADGRRIP